MEDGGGNGREGRGKERKGGEERPVRSAGHTHIVVLARLKQKIADVCIREYFRLHNERKCSTYFFSHYTLFFI